MCALHVFDHCFFVLFQAVFFAGLESVVRAEMWPFLLHYYPYNSTFETRERLRNDKYIEYQNIRKTRWVFVETVRQSRARFACFCLSEHWCVCMPAARCFVLIVISTDNA